MSETRNPPSVSVVVPSYNHGIYLARRIKSILNQTYRDLEVIVIDDASTDNSREIISGFEKDERLKAVFREKNSGNLFKNWNMGVRKARGKFIWIAESDDYADPGFLETMVEILIENPSVGLAYCQSTVIDKNGDIIRSMIEYTADLDDGRWKQSYLNRGPDECTRYLIYKNTIPNASAVLFRKDVYVRSGYADESVYYGNDWLTWVSMLIHSDVAFVAQPLNFYREHQRTVRSQMDMTENEAEASLKVIEYIHRELKPDKPVMRRALGSWIKSWVNMIYRGKGGMNSKVLNPLLDRVRVMDAAAEWRWMKEMLVFPVRLMVRKAASMTGAARK